MKGFSNYIIGGWFSLTLLSCAGEATDDTIDQDSTATVSDSLEAGAAFTEFCNYVADLPAEIANIDSMFAHYEAAKTNFSVEEKDSSFFVAMAFMNGFEVSEEEVGDYSQKAMKDIEKKYGKAGFQVWYAEGYPYIVTDIKFLENRFKKDISADLDDYLDVLKKTFVQVTSDAGLVISWNELADLTLTCEEYMVENPDSKYQENVLVFYEDYLRFLMWGLDNTPILEWPVEGQPNQLNAEVSETYQKLIKDDRHKTGKIIADHLTWLESKNFEYTYEETEYLTSDEVKMYLGIN